MMLTPPTYPPRAQSVPTDILVSGGGSQGRSRPFAVKYGPGKKKWKLSRGNKPRL